MSGEALGLTGIGCTVYADGVRIADGTPGDDELDPTILSGLTITWGRSTTVDQPESSTCTFELVDERGGRAFLDQLVVGTPIDVDAVVAADPGDEGQIVDTIVDGAMLYDPAGRSLVDPGGELRWFRAAYEVGYVILRRPMSSASTQTRALIAPDAFEPADGDLGAWETITRPLPGDEVTFSVRLRRRRPQDWPAPRVQVGFMVTDTPWRPGAIRVDVDGGVLATASVSLWSSVTLTVPAGTPVGWWMPVLTVDTFDLAWSDLTIYNSGYWSALWVLYSDVAWDMLDDVYANAVGLEAPNHAVARGARVFSGRVTSAVLAWPDDADAPRVQVVAHDFLADLDNRDVGDEPWPAEPLGARVARVLGLSGLAILARVDASAAARVVTWRDVDRQSASGLLQELAASADAVMWAATHRVTGPIVEIEDPANRAALYTLAEYGGVVYVTPTLPSLDVLDLDACTILRDPLEWAQDVQDVATIVAVGWLEQTLDEDGYPAPTERTHTAVDAGGAAAFGSRRVGLQSQLATEADAADVASRLLTRLSVLEWRAHGLTLDDRVLDESVDVVAVREVFLDLLDGVQRIGAPLRVSGLPDWTPAGSTALVYLEGGAYAFEDGAWVLELVVSSATALGHSATWAELVETWTWAQFDAAVTWAALTGVRT